MTGRRIKPPDPSPGLFDAPTTPIGPAERSAAEAITAWIAAGELEAVLAFPIRAQARAIDLAVAGRDPWQIGKASRSFVDLLTSLGLVHRGDATADPFEAMIAALTAESTDGLDDVDEDSPADRSAPAP